MKKINKIIYLFLSMFVLVFVLTSCDIEGLINEYLPGVDIPFLDGDTEVPTINETLENYDPCQDGSHKFEYLSKNDEYSHNLICSRCATITTEEHKFDKWTIVSDATSDENGIKIRNCLICGYAETMEIPALNDNVDEPTTENLPIECTVSEALLLPLGTEVIITGYIVENEKYYDIQDGTSSIRLYNIDGHVHEQLYGKVEGTIFEYNGLIELCPCSFTPLDETQLDSITLGNIINDNSELYDGLKFILKSEDKILSCCFNTYYQTSNYDINSEYHYGCFEVLTLIKSDEKWLIKTQDNKYLYSDTRNTLLSSTEINEFCYWNIEINEEKEAFISNSTGFYIKFNQYNRAVTGTANYSITPSIYIVEDYIEYISKNEKMYITGSFNNYECLDEYELNYEIITNTYYINLDLKEGDSFNISNINNEVLFDKNNTICFYEFESDDNLLYAFKDGNYAINIEMSNNLCFIYYFYYPEDVYLYETVNETRSDYKFNIANDETNLVLNIALFTDREYSIVSMFGMNYYDNLGIIDENVIFDETIIKINKDSNYLIIIEDYQDFENHKLHIVQQFITVDVATANELPNSFSVKIDGEFYFENNYWYIKDETGSIMIYNCDGHAHEGDKGSIFGIIHTYNGQKEIVNGYYESNYNN